MKTACKMITQQGSEILRNRNRKMAIYILYKITTDRIEEKCLCLKQNCENSHRSFWSKKDC